MAISLQKLWRGFKVRVLDFVAEVKGMKTTEAGMKAVFQKKSNSRGGKKLRQKEKRSQNQMMLNGDEKKKGKKNDRKKKNNIYKEANKKRRVNSPPQTNKCIPLQSRVAYVKAWRNLNVARKKRQRSRC